MQTITSQLLALDPTLSIHNEGAWNAPFDPTSKGYSSFNDAGVECEVGEFLYSWVRVLKPEHVLETGTHHGIGMSYMGLALSHNNQGHLDTIEFLPEIHKVASDRREKLGLQNQVTCHFGDAAQFTPQTTYQFILLDTEPILRFNELLKFYPHLDAGGYIFIHDTPRDLTQGNINPDHPELPSWPFGNVPEAMKQLVIDGFLRPFHFPTPRGLVGFYKVHPNDLAWWKL